MFRAAFTGKVLGRKRHHLIRTHDIMIGAMFPVEIIWAIGAEPVVSGRNNDASIYVGDVFQWLYRATYFPPENEHESGMSVYTEERLITLRVDTIEAYNRSIEELSGGVSGRISLSGSGGGLLQAYDDSTKSFDLLAVERIV